MSASVDNIVPEQVRLIREEIGEITPRLTVTLDRLGDMDANIDVMTGVVIGLGRAVHDIDGRVGHPEDRMGD